MRLWPCCLLLCSCLDLGYAVPPPGDAGSLDAAADPYGDGGAQDDDGGNAGCVEGPVGTAAEAVEIVIGTLSVDRPSIRVPAGGVVRWRNRDSMIHRMQAGVAGAELSLAQGGFDSLDLGPGGAYAHRFCRPRGLIYHCSTHPALMTGYRITVE